MIRLILSFAILTALCVPCFALELYVAPDGDDAGPGTINRPFATIARARNAIRQAKQTAKGPVTIYLRGGAYYLNDTPFEWEYQKLLKALLDLEILDI